MRQRGLLIREWGSTPAFPADLVTGFLQRHATMWIVCGLTAILLGHVGAFHTAETAPYIRYPYFMSLTLVGGLIGSLLLDHFHARRLFERRAMAQAVLLVLVISTLLTPVVWVMAALALNGSWEAARMAALFPQVVPVAAVFVLLQLVFVRRLSDAEPPIEGKPCEQARPAQPRIGPDSVQASRLDSAGLQAIEAEDHYLRLHTAEGSRLIMMRLADAIEELHHVEGGQTHRSWWVSKHAVVSASRGRGRASLRLANGIIAPVSRTFAPALREAGWF